MNFLSLVVIPGSYYSPAKPYFFFKFSSYSAFLAGQRSLVQSWQEKNVTSVGNNIPDLDFLGIINM